MNAMRFNVVGIWSAIWNFHARISRLSRMRSIKRNFNPSAERGMDFLHRVIKNLRLIADNGRIVADIRSPSDSRERRISHYRNSPFSTRIVDAQSRRILASSWSSSDTCARTIDPRIPRPRALRSFDLRSGEIVSKSCQAVVWQPAVLRV